MSKVRLLFLMRDFVQAGAQRFQFEVIRAIDKERYDVDVLVPQRLDNGEGMFPKEYYFPLVKTHAKRIILMSEVGSHIFKPLSILRGWKGHFKETSPIQHLFDYVITRLENRHNWHLAAFLDQYDVINLTEYDFCFVKNCITDTDKVFTYIMTAKVQTHPLSQFKDYDPTTNYNFVVDWDKDYEQNELSYFTKGYRMIRFPLVLNCAEYDSLPEVHIDGTFHIGLFTRISPLKPLEPFIYALHLLRGRGIDAKLHLFGAVANHGSSLLEMQRIQRNMRMLQLTDHVIFEGHQESMGKAAQEADIQLVWCQGFNGLLGGYAALELMLQSLPHVFYDIEPYDLHRDQEAWPMPCFFQLERFASYTAKMLNDTEQRRKLAAEQRQYIIDRRDVTRHMPTLYAEFDRIAASRQRPLSK
ncbi:MAG: hypothetical protein K9J06_03825 [Flavobacteriales bacterium]|nr:hypothetical protein [Flavobacteriales bacterium]